MKNFLNKAMLTLVVFGLAIVSSFAMETDPPTEPIKTTIKTEVVTETPTAILDGLAYFDEDLIECIWVREASIPNGCSVSGLGSACIEKIDNVDRHLFYATKDESTNMVTCVSPLYEIIGD